MPTYARAATVECDNLGATEEVGRNTEDSWNLTQWKLKAEELANQKLELEKKARHLETELLLQKLESDKIIWDLKDDIAKDLERNFREDKSTRTNPDPEAEGLHTATSSWKSSGLLVSVSTTKSQNDTATGEGHDDDGKENSGDTSSLAYWKLKLEEMTNQKLKSDKKVRDLEAELDIQKREFVKKILRDFEVELGAWKGTAKEVESKVPEMDLTEDRGDELNSFQIIEPGEKEHHPSREKSPSTHSPATSAESEMTSPEPRREDLPTTASGSKTSKSQVGSTKCDNFARTGTGEWDNNEVDGSSSGSSDVNLDPLLDEHMETRPSDFSVVSKGYCFLCLNKTSPFVNSSSSSVISFEDISRYLKLDMRKVLIQIGPVPSHLLAKVQRARLTVELCEGCSNLTRDISKRCQQSGKLKMDIESGLESMYGKMQQADETGRTEQFRKVMGCEWNSGMGSGMEILEVLRMETKRKCLRKINTTSLRSHQKTVKILLKVPDSIPGQMTDSGEKPDIIQIEEAAVANCVAKDDDVKQNDNSVADDFHDEVIEESDSGPDVVRIGDGPKDRKRTKKAEIERKWTINRGKGTYKCRLCPRGAEYETRGGVYVQYNKDHLKLRFKCRICGKEFTRKESYEVHHQSVHLGVRFPCQGCEKTFTTKGHLKAHQRKAGCPIGGK